MLGGRGVSNRPGKQLALKFVPETQGKSLLAHSNSQSAGTCCAFTFTVFLKEINTVLYCLMLNSQGKQKEVLKAIPFNILPLRIYGKNENLDAQLSETFESA